MPSVMSLDWAVVQPTRPVLAKTAVLRTTMDGLDIVAATWIG